MQDQVKGNGGENTQRADGKALVGHLAVALAVLPSQQLTAQRHLACRQGPDFADLPTVVPAASRFEPGL
ncbi:hypothetical protein AVO45_01725 [Ruegeria marisrubri]|uniref:Uncharacterized protein n=1 Tax=Ruegeria marisrubri TaxID=1685379 RepID=A0A101CYJ8_9RHOB|nr:hypothetical protein [Ruegeria marisrubri]KUJ85731.1 hypothetical protein AVO45_01725 [Ruegeria marisrubri]